ncbi:MAG: hypothetical protein FWH40_00550 [Coriobacteriia bacterium]|nr:hypothetical protein [Coriobacteriia bacterium]
MDLYDSIFSRKSTRKYNLEALGNEDILKIEDALGTFQELYEGIGYQHRIIPGIRGLLSVKAPHYLMISGSGAANELEAVGFFYEQFVLWLNANGYGSVWLGGAKDADAPSDNDLIAIAFGIAADSPHRDLGDFDRKPMEEITNSPDDQVIAAVRLAPSGMNAQPWYFEKADGQVLVYRKNLNTPISQFYRQSDLDMGIALSHYAIALAHEGQEFDFTRTDQLPDKPRYTAFGIIA